MGSSFLPFNRRPGDASVLRGGAVTPKPEITSIVCGPDINLSLNGKAFSIYRSAADFPGAAHVGVYLSFGLAEITLFDFTGLSGADFAAVGAGKSVLLSNAGARVALWFNVDSTNTQPVVGGATAYVEVPISALDDDTTLAQEFGSAATDWQIALPTPTTVQATDFDNGARTDGTAGNTSVVVTVTQQGRNNATPPAGFDATLVAESIINTNAAGIANTVSNAMDGNGWSVDNSTPGTAIATDAANGARVAAADVNTGFTISVTQIGAP